MSDLHEVRDPALRREQKDRLSYIYRHITWWLKWPRRMWLRGGIEHPAIPGRNWRTAEPESQTNIAGGLLTAIAVAIIAAATMAAYKAHDTTVANAPVLQKVVAR